MTEAAWLTSEDPFRMLTFLSNSKASDRKLRLFQCGCCRRIWRLLPDEHYREAVRMAERYADGRASDRERLRVRKLLQVYPDPADLADVNARFAVRHVCEKTVSRNCRIHDADAAAAHAAKKSALGDPTTAYKAVLVAEEKIHSHLLRDIFGNPFRSVIVDASWLTPAAVALARSMYDESTFDQMPELADALEAAGCTNPEILEHCRGVGPHARGCWVVDLILGKE